MKQHNEFPEESRHLLHDSWRCWYCDENTIDCLHHIVGRGSKGSTVESSILNAAPLCNQKCHLKHHSLLKTDKMVVELLKKTVQYLISTGYSLTENDINFINKYEKYYKKINLDE